MDARTLRGTALRRYNPIKIAIGCITRSSGVMIEEEFKGIQLVGGFPAVILYRVM